MINLDQIQALFWTQKILALSMLIQSVELFVITGKLQAKAIWNWDELKRDWSNKIVQNSLAFFLSDKRFQLILILRILCAAALLFFSNSLLLAILLALTYLVALRFRGPFNGGSDYMTIQVLVALNLYYLTTDSYWQGVALWYLVLQVVLSYFIAGWVKLIRPEWRSGLAISRFVLNSNYRVPTLIKNLFRSPILCFTSSWIILFFECLFPVILFRHSSVIYFVGSALVFHLMVFIIFGLNRFVWAWSATYPIVIFCTHNKILLH